jgi:hypothetical protein
LQGAAGTLFFWSYMLLVFMVLLNFLLAIIVDAFGEVKEGTREKVGRGAAGWLRCCLGWLRACLAVGRWLLAAAARAVLVCVATCVPGSPQVGLHTELARLAAAKWRALMGRLGSGHISDRRLGLLLKSWAGEEGEGSDAGGRAGAAERGGQRTVKVRAAAGFEATAVLNGGPTMHAAFLWGPAP